MNIFALGDAIPQQKAKKGEDSWCKSCMNRRWELEVNGGIWCTVCGKMFSESSFSEGQKKKPACIGKKCKLHSHEESVYREVYTGQG